MDLGIQYQPSFKRVQLGLSLVNAGRKERGHFEDSKQGGFLPLEMKTGIAYKPVALPRSNLLWILRSRGIITLT